MFEELKKRLHGGTLGVTEETEGKLTVERRIMAMKNHEKKKKAALLQEYQPLNVTNRETAGGLSEEREADLQGNKIVEINRMLADDQYSVGKQLQEFREQLTQELENDSTFSDASKYVPARHPDEAARHLRQVHTAHHRLARQPRKRKDEELDPPRAPGVREVRL